MKNDYLIFTNASWVDMANIQPPIKIEGQFKLYLNKRGVLDKRRKEYKLLMKQAPMGYYSILADTSIAKYE